MLIPYIKNQPLKALDKFAVQKIECVNWIEYPYKPDVCFAIAHDGDNIYLKFSVDEQCTAALATQDDADVHKDSCVEFFVALDDHGYYNYEVNAIGALKLHYKDSSGVSRASAQTLASIGRESTFVREAFAEEDAPATSWQMLLTIPRESLFRHNVASLSGLRATANFYKCGDDLSMPHFLSWSPIDFPNPSFHQPTFFSEITFE